MNANPVSVATTLNIHKNKLPGQFVVDGSNVLYTESRPNAHDVYKHYVNLCGEYVVMRSGHGDAKRLKEYHTHNGMLSPEHAHIIVRTVKSKRAKFIRTVQANLDFCEGMASIHGWNAQAQYHPKGTTIRNVYEMNKTFIAGMV